METINKTPMRPVKTDIGLYTRVLAALADQHRQNKMINRGGRGGTSAFIGRRGKWRKGMRNKARVEGRRCRV